MKQWQSLLRNRELSGGGPSRRGEPSFERQIGADRIDSLELSRDRYISKAFSGSIFTLDVDQFEQRFLLSGSSNGSLAIFDLCEVRPDRKSVSPVVASIPRGSRRAHKYMVVCAQWFPNDTGMLATSSTDQQLRVWDANVMRAVETFTFSRPLSQHHWAPFEPSVIAVAPGTSNAVLVDLKSGSSMRQLCGHKANVNCVRWSPRRAHLLATGGYDGRLLLWDVRSGRRHLAQLRPAAAAAAHAHTGVVNGLCFSGDGLQLLSNGTDSNLRVWDAVDMKECAQAVTEVGTARRPRAIVGVQFATPVGVPRKLVDVAVRGSGADLTAVIPVEERLVVVRPFAARNGRRGRRRRWELQGHLAPVNAVVWRAASDELVSAANDRALLLWLPRSDQTPVDESQRVSTLRQDRWSDDED